MLQSLRIRNLALLDEVELDFESGFTAVTGETGPRIDISPPVWRTWWFWTLIGAVVVGASTAGLVLALQPKHDGLYGGPVTLR